MNTHSSWKRLAWLCVLVVGAAGAQSQGAAPAKAAGRTVGALPDWSGLWQLDGIGIGASGALVYTPEGLAHRKELEQGPYNEMWQPKLQAHLKARDETPTDPEACDTQFPDIMIRAPIMFRAVVSPKATVLLFAGRQVRVIHTDGGKHPVGDALVPSPWGDSIGHWENGTLLVDTTGVIASTFRATDLPQSEQVHYTERIRMRDKDTLEDQMTIDDPVAFTHPWKLTRDYKRVEGIERMPMRYCFAPDYQQTK
ncbi:MAG TPA: hypothetical protein VMI92_12930 [Steroidobacteraceae bacterium]|nr:hypothetical protein [Steroidobacteraceae bacterium]